MALSDDLRAARPQTAIRQPPAQGALPMTSEPTTLSIEDLKACLAGEPVWTDWSGGERPVGEDDKVFYRMREDTDADVSQRDSWRAGDLIWRHARFDDDGGHFPDNNIVAYRLDPTALSPATIAALIEGYIAMAEAKPLEWVETPKGLYATGSLGVYWVFEHDGEWFWQRRARITDPMKMMIGPDEAKAAAQADYERRILSALNIGGTND